MPQKRVSTALPPLTLRTIPVDLIRLPFGANHRARNTCRDRKIKSAGAEPRCERRAWYGLACSRRRPRNEIKVYMPVALHMKHTRLNSY